MSSQHENQRTSWLRETLKVFIIVIALIAAFQGIALLVMFAGAAIGRALP